MTSIIEEEQSEDLISQTTFNEGYQVQILPSIDSFKFDNLDTQLTIRSPPFKKDPKKRRVKYQKKTDFQFFF